MNIVILAFVLIKNIFLHLFRSCRILFSELLELNVCFRAKKVFL